MRVSVTQDVARDPGAVWDALVAWERQAEWMVDAVAVEVVGDRREGVGVRLRVPTRVVGFVVQDVMEVVAWEPPARLDVRHLGRLISGEGGFRLQQTAAGTRVTWWEEVTAPLGALGEAVGRVAVAPYLRWLFGRSLRRFRRRCESAVARPAEA